MNNKRKIIIVGSHLVFLPDSKDRHSDINGIQTSNDKYNLLLCQNRFEPDILLH